MDGHFCFDQFKCSFKVNRLNCIINELQKYRISIYSICFHSWVAKCKYTSNIIMTLFDVNFTNKKKPHIYLKWFTENSFYRIKRLSIHQIDVDI